VGVGAGLRFIGAISVACVPRFPHAPAMIGFECWRPLPRLLLLHRLACLNLACLSFVLHDTTAIAALFPSSISIDSITYPGASSHLLSSVLCPARASVGIQH
jgi:hypothetical protein